MAYGTVNADVIGTSVAGSNLGAGDASLMKNRIINGAMVIDQRNAGASVTNTAGPDFICDRFMIQSTATSKLSGQQVTTAPAGFNYSTKITSLSAYSVGSTDFFLYSQGIEGYNIADFGWGTANAKTVTLSFWVQSSLTGTFGGSLDSTTYGSYPFSYTISSANTWTQISITIAGPTTSGTFNTTNGAGFYVRFGLGVGSTYSGTAGSWVVGTRYFSATGATSVVGTSGATFYITGVQLEVGSSATGFEYVNYQTSLANCQRYYEFGGQATETIWCGNTTNGSPYYYGFSFKVTKRAAPTITTANIAAGNFPATGSTVNTNGVTGSQVMRTANATGNSGYYGDTWTASAEL